MVAGRSSPIEQVVPWIARAAWIMVAVFGGAAIEAAVDGRSNPVRLVAAIGGWVLWGVVAVGLAIPSVRSLTAVRVGAPLALAAAAVSAIAGAPAVDVAVLAVTAIATCAAVATAEFGRAYVQSSAYGDEDRLPLRPPLAAGFAAAIAWAMWAACLLSGPFLLAAHSWIAGAVLTVLAIVGLLLFPPRWHRLSRRWLVLVPAGLVVHDPVVLADTVMLRTNQVSGLRLAPADTTAADLTGPASGYAIEVTATESVTTVFAFTPKDPDGRAIHMTAFLVSPSRPGLALRLAAARGLPVT